MKSDCKENAFRDALQNLADEVTAVIAVTDKGEHVIASNCDRVYRALCDAKDALAAAQRSAAAPEPGGERLPGVIDFKSPPSLELLLAYAHRRARFHDDDYTREWHRIMSEEFGWRDPKTGEALKHWGVLFRIWRKNRAMIEKVRDPDRIPDARNRVRGQLSNHLETPKEVRDELLRKCGF